MKGTPLFTGEYELPRGASEDRVNIWPLLYYNEPALSVLWPIGEYTDNRLAIRPFLTIEDMDKDKRIYNVLWPFGRFNQQAGDSYIFPFFWGDDYAVAFPLYWHFDEPFGGKKRGVDALWPLWCYFRDDEQYSLHLTWPFFNIKTYKDNPGWRLWPLYGRYETPVANKGYSYTMWPLGWHTWAPEREAWTLFPLFHYGRQDDKYTFGTVLGGWHHDVSEQRTEWLATPILGWGSSTPESSRSDLFLGLAGTLRSADKRHSRLLPLYYHTTSKERSFFVSPLYAQAKNEREDSKWSYLLPLYYHSQNPDRSLFVSALYSRGKEKQREQTWSYLLPLYYADSTRDGTTFITPLGGWWHDAEGSSWAAFPLLTGMRRDPRGGSFWLLGPIGHAEWDAKGHSHWLLPFYAYSHHADAFYSLPYCSWQEGNTRRRLLPLLLSAQASRPDRWDLWSLAGLLHASGGENPGSNHLFPLYYSNPKEQTFLSLLYAGWDSQYGRSHALPPLLSGWTSGERATEVFALLGLFHARWGSDVESSGHLFPLYAYDRFKFITPIFGHIESDGTRTEYWLTPIAGRHTGHTSGSWFFPIYNHKRTGENTEGTFLLMGDYHSTPKSSAAGFPLLFRHERWKAAEEAVDDAAWRARVGSEFHYLLHFGKFADYEESQRLPRQFNSDTPRLSALQHQTKSPEYTRIQLRQNRFWPLWNFTSRKQVHSDWQRASGNLLLCLYDTKREVGHTSRDATSRNAHDYIRRRILFRLIHYERLNGGTSVDIFPAITYDRNPEKDMRKVSFLWRFFRYQREKDSKKIDLLFIPIWRSGGE